MITKREAIPLLLAACPSFQQWYDGVGRILCTDQTWQNHGWKVLSVFCGHLARHLLALYQTQKTDSFSAVCQVIERLHTDGEAEVRDVAIKDFLESIECIWNYYEVDPNCFFAFLGPSTARYWRDQR